MFSLVLWTKWTSLWYTKCTCECNTSHPCLGAWDRHFCFHYWQSDFHCSADHAWSWQSLPPSTITKLLPAWREEVPPDSDSITMMVGCRHCQFLGPLCSFEESYSAPDKQTAGEQGNPDSWLIFISNPNLLNVFFSLKSSFIKFWITVG